MVQVPMVAKVTTPPEIPQIVVEAESMLSVTGSPDVAVAVGVYAAPATASGGPVEEKLPVCDHSSMSALAWSSPAETAFTVSVLGSWLAITGAVKHPHDPGRLASLAAVWSCPLSPQESTSPDVVTASMNSPPAEMEVT